MGTTERRTELDMEGPLIVEYCAFGKFSSGEKGDKGQWDHSWVTMDDLKEHLEEDEIEDALDEYGSRQDQWRVYLTSDDA